MQLLSVVQNEHWLLIAMQLIFLLVLSLLFVANLKYAALAEVAAQREDMLFFEKRIDHGLLKLQIDS